LTKGFEHEEPVGRGEQGGAKLYVRRARRAAIVAHYSYGEENKYLGVGGLPRWIQLYGFQFILIWMGNYPLLLVETSFLRTSSNLALYMVNCPL